jgi:hypothetical protein
MLVLQYLADYFMKLENLQKEDGTTRIPCVMELQVNNQHLLQTNPVEKYGAWFDNIVLRAETLMKFMFFFQSTSMIV